MIVTANTDKVVASLKQFHLMVQRKMNNMIRGFAYDITAEAIANTPLGNAQAFIDRYRERQEALGLNPEEGWARGSWQVAAGGNFTITDRYGVSSGDQALIAVKSSLSGLTFKDNIYIGNRGYYIGMLEANYSPQTNNLGIMKPTMSHIMQVYKISLKQHYDQG